jgi:hypothetical protein
VLLPDKRALRPAAAPDKLQVRRTGPSDARSARSKQEPARHRYSLSEIVQGRRLNEPRWRLFAAVNSPRLGFPVVVSLGGCHLLGDRLVSALVPDSLKALPVELVEADAVGLMSDQEVEDRPDER